MIKLKYIYNAKLLLKSNDFKIELTTICKYKQYFFYLKTYIIHNSLNYFIYLLTEIIL